MRFAAGYGKKGCARRSDFSVKVAAKEPSWRTKAGSLAGSSWFGVFLAQRLSVQRVQEDGFWSVSKERQALVFALRQALLYSRSCW